MDEKKIIKVKPCPLCGANMVKEIIDDNDIISSQVYWEHEVSSITCPLIFFSITEDQIEAWNIRHQKNCPWCGDGDFDLIGLKIHIESGWCPEYNHANYRKRKKSDAGKWLTGEKTDDT